MDGDYWEYYNNEILGIENIKLAVKFLTIESISLPVPVRSKPVIVHKTMVDTISLILYNIFIRW